MISDYGFQVLKFSLLFVGESLNEFYFVNFDVWLFCKREELKLFNGEFLSGEEVPPGIQTLYSHGYLKVLKFLKIGETFGISSVYFRFRFKDGI